MPKGEDRRLSYEDALEEARRFRAMADRAHDIIARYRVLPEPRMEYINPAAERITGYPLQDFYDDPHMGMKLIHPEDRERLALMMQRAPEELTVPITLRYIHKDGHIVWIEQRQAPELDDQGRVVASESISRDVTEQVRLENDLRRAQKLEAIGRLAGGVAHDFNNLLGVTLLCAERLRKALDDDPKHGQWVKMILESAHRGADLTQQLLDFARREGRLEGQCELNRVVRELQPMLARLLPEDVHLNTRLAADDSLVALDQGQLEQVLVNLVVNARDAMEQGGVLTIGTDNREASEGELRGAPTAIGRASTVELHVSDTGSGVPEEIRERIYEPFFTTKDATRGSGMGLSVVYGIVKQSGGQIELRSTMGEGSVFTMRWPLASAAAVHREPAPVSEPAAGGDELLLLVEDDPLLRRLEVEMLRSLGYRLLEAGTVEDAERAYAESPERVDLLLTDVVLPDGSGVTLADRLRERDGTLRVVYTTGHTDAEMTRHGLPAGQLMLVTKPFTEGELALVVRAALEDE